MLTLSGAPRNHYTRALILNLGSPSNKLFFAVFSCQHADRDATDSAGFQKYGFIVVLSGVLGFKKSATRQMLTRFLFLLSSLAVSVCECMHHVRTGDESVIQVLSSRLFPLNRGPYLMVIVAISM